MPRPPTLVQHIRQILGRAFRETGQALDRVGVSTAMLASTPHSYYDDPVAYQDYLSRHRQLMPLLWSGRPVVHPEVAYLAPCATLIGSVTVGSGSSIWYGAVLRADECLNAESYSKTDEELLLTENNNSNSTDGDYSSAKKNVAWRLTDARLSDRIDHHGGAIFIGNDTNVQDNCIITSRQQHTIIGNGVTIGHLAQIHSATVEDFCLIGMGSIIQEGAKIETESFVAAGAVVGPGQVVKSGELWVGNPARKLKDLSDKERTRLHYQSSEYVTVATGQQGVMDLGGNVSEHTITTDDSKDDDDRDETEQLIIHSR